MGVSYAAISQKRHQLCDDPKHLPFNKPTSPKMNQNSFFVGSWIGPLKGINGIILDIFSTMTFCCRFIRVFPWCGSARDVLAGIGRQKQLKLCTVQQIKYNLVIKIFCPLDCCYAPELQIHENAGFSKPIAGSSLQITVCYWLRKSSIFMDLQLGSIAAV